MSQTPYTVTVVLDRNYGDRLSDLPAGQPVWIVDTPPNREAAEKQWAQHPGGDHLTGVTTFKSAENQSAEAMLIGEFDTIDMHHDVYPANPPYTVVDVIGAQLTNEVKAKLSEFGFADFEATAAGFRAVRPLPADFDENRWR